VYALGWAALGSVSRRRLGVNWPNGSALTAGHFWQTPGWPAPGRTAPPKVSKKSCPLHPARLRWVPSRHHRSRGTTGCGPPTKGRPWPIAALGSGILLRSTACVHAVVAACMPLNPLRNDATRPSDGAFGVVCDDAEQTVGAMFLLWLLRSAFAVRSAIHKSPKQRGLRIPSGGRSLAKRSNSRRLARRASAANQVTRRGAK
jgi:hypothetical protein